VLTRWLFSTGKNPPHPRRGSPERGGSHGAYIATAATMKQSAIAIRAT
jgi:hypothetical protein